MQLVPIKNWKYSSPTSSNPVGVTPTSSCVSRIAAANAVSPASTAPGPLIFPAPNPRFFRINKIFPSRITKHKFAYSVGTHAAQSIRSTCKSPASLTPHLPFIWL